MKNFPDPQQIEHELRNIQREIAPNEARTNLFNLVVYTQDKQDFDLMGALDVLHGKRPARVIIVRRGCAGETHTAVSARCVEDHEGRSLCVQEIIIFSGEDKAGEDPNAWGPLLVRDIPVFAWWQDKLVAGNEVPGLFEDYADRCLIDSALAADPLAFYRNLTASGKLGKVPVSDFSWVRLAPVMKHTAQLFNPAEQRPRLHNVTGITLSGGLASEAFLFFQWFKTKLEWTGTGAGPGKDWKLHNAAGDPVTLVHRTPAALSKGFKIEFTVKGGEGFVFESSIQGFATLKAPGQDAYTAVFRIVGDGDALIGEVDKSGSDRLFLEAVSNL